MMDKRKFAKRLSLDTARTWFETDDIGDIGKPTYNITIQETIPENDRGMPVGESLLPT